MSTCRCESALWPTWHHTSCTMSANGPTSARVAAYIPIPSSAVLIPPPSIEPLSKETRPVLSSQDSGASTSHAIAPSFPPSTSNPSLATSSRKGGTTTGIGSIGISTNVSDLLLSSLLPPGLPKLPSSTTASSGPGLSPGAGAKDGKGLARPRELSTVREGLRLDVMSNNFRRFVTKVGPVFWLQDRVEEVLFWRKPTWTWAWLMAWAAICASESSCPKGRTKAIKKELMDSLSTASPTLRPLFHTASRPPAHQRAATSRKDPVWCPVIRSSYRHRPHTRSKGVQGVLGEWQCRSFHHRRTSRCRERWGPERYLERTRGIGDYWSRWRSLAGCTAKRSREWCGLFHEPSSYPEYHGLGVSLYPLLSYIVVNRTTSA